MASRVRKGVIGGVLALGVGVSGGLVGCSDSESSNSDTSGSTKGSLGSSSSTTTTINMSDRIGADLSAHSLSAKESGRYSGGSLVAITGTINNKTDKEIELTPDTDNVFFNCQFKRDELFWTGDPEDVCDDGATKTVKISPHGKYVADDSKGIVMEGSGPFNIEELVSDGNDDYRIAGGNKQFVIRLDDMNTKVSKYVSKEDAEVWVTMKGV